MSSTTVSTAPPGLTDSLFGPTGSLRSLRHRDYRRWMGAGLVSVSGTWMQQVALAWLVYDRSGSGTAVGVTIALHAVPTLVLGLWGGGVVDRHDTRRLLLVTQLLHAALAVVLALAVVTNVVSVGLLSLVALAGGIVGVVDGPASGAHGAALLPPADLGNGLALGSVVSSTGRVLGLALAGSVVAVVGPAAAFALNAASFAAPIAVLALTDAGRRAGHAGSGGCACGADGLASVWRSPVARSTLLTAWVLGCLGRNFQVTTAMMAAEVFTGRAGLYGLFSSLFAVGALVGSVAATRIPTMTRRVLAGAGTVAALLQVTSGTATSPVVFGALLVAIAACAVVVDTCVSTRVQLTTDPAARGRVLAVCGIVGTTAGLVGAPLLGWLGETFGPRVPLVIGGAVAAVVALRHGAVTNRTGHEQDRSRTGPVTNRTGHEQDRSRTGPVTNRTGDERPRCAERNGAVSHHQLLSYFLVPQKLLTSACRSQPSSPPDPPKVQSTSPLPPDTEIFP